MLAIWINVDECIRRRDLMINQFKNINFITKNIRVSAITPDDVDDYVMMMMRCDDDDDVMMMAM